jgi:hypothetical protein
MNKLILLTALLLLGCATEQGYRDMLNSWGGKTGDSLIEAWGPPNPQKTFIKDNGDRVYTWDRWETGGWMPDWCSTIVTVGKEGLIHNLNYHGNCRSR